MGHCGAGAPAAAAAAGRPEVSFAKPYCRAVGSGGVGAAAGGGAAALAGCFIATAFIGRLVGVVRGTAPAGALGGGWLVAGGGILPTGFLPGGLAGAAGGILPAGGGRCLTGCSPDGSGRP